MAPLFTFRTIDVERDAETIVQFRKDSFLVSLGSIDGFGDRNQYLAWIGLNAVLYPEGFVLMEHEGKVVGQMEAEVVPYRGKRVGYVDLFYLVPEYRGKGYGQIQLERAEALFRKWGVSEYHLRVSPTNKPAMRFYEKHGFSRLEFENIGGYDMWRMVKRLYANDAESSGESF